MATNVIQFPVLDTLPIGGEIESLTFERVDEWSDVLASVWAANEAQPDARLSPRSFEDVTAFTTPPSQLVAIIATARSRPSSRSRFRA